MIDDDNDNDLISIKNKLHIYNHNHNNVKQSNWNSIDSNIISSREWPLISVDDFDIVEHSTLIFILYINSFIHIIFDFFIKNYQ